MNISAKELAKLINVSPATVSMVFNNNPASAMPQESWF